MLLHDPVTKKGVSKKLKRRWTGPYFITEVGDGYVYKLCHCGSGQTHVFVVPLPNLEDFTGLEVQAINCSEYN